MARGQFTPIDHEDQRHQARHGTRRQARAGLCFDQQARLPWKPVQNAIGDFCEQRENRSDREPKYGVADYDHAVAAVRSDLGEKTFALTWAEGRTMRTEQVLIADKQSIQTHQSQQNPHRSK